MVAEVNNQIASGFKRARNYEGQHLGRVFYISDSKILMSMWVTRGYC